MYEIRLVKNTKSIQLVRPQKTIQLTQVGRRGNKGDPGEGVPTGGTAGQVLTKDSGADFDTSWQDASGSIDSVVAGNNIDVDNTDPNNPIVSVENLTLSDITDVTATATEVNYTDGVTSNIQTQLDEKATNTALDAHTNNTSNPHSVTKAQVGLGSVDNTSDIDKPVSTAQATADAAVASAAASSLSAHTTNTSNPHSVTKAQVGLGNVDNTSDTNKPISTATQTALDTKANDSDVVKLTGNQTVAGDKTFTGKVLVDGNAGSSTVGALKIEGTTDVRYFQISGPTAQPFTITDTRTSSANLGAGLAIGSNDGAAMESGHRLGYLLANGTDNGTTARNAVAFSFYASDNWTSGYYPAHMNIETSDGTGARVERIRIGGTGTQGVTINENGLNKDTRIEGDTDQNLVFVDASTDRVGIGNNAPTQKLDVTGNIAVSGTVDGRDVSVDGTKLDGIEANADVTDATNVAAAGAVMEADTTTASMSFVIDEDTMVSNLATKVPTQQSTKAYVDTQIGALPEFAEGAGIALTDLGGGVTEISVDGASVDHGSLAGLSDDDHTQYALLAGRSGGQTLRGGTSKTNNLVLSANNQAYDNKSNGYIEITHPIVWDDNINIGATFTGFFSEGYHRFISQTGTFTLDPTMNAGEVVALKSAATIKYSSSQIITASPTFMSQNTIQPTAAVNDNALSSWSSYIANDRFMPLLTTAITATTTNFIGLQSAPTVGIAAGSHASASGVATNLTAVEAASKVTAQGTATNAIGVLVHNPVKEGSGVVTNNIGVDIESMTSGSTLNVGLRIAPSISTGAQAIQITGTPTTAAGGIAFGSDTTLYRSAADTLKTDDKLFVVGELELDGALNHDGTTVGFYGTAPVAQSTGWSATNVTTDKSFDANATTLDELADVVGTLINELKNTGLIGA